MARKRRELQEINAGSMADIAFLLLVFFLVTTTMDTSWGLARRLPPPIIDEQETPPIKQRNVFVVLANANDQLLVEGELMDITQLRAAAKEFIANPKRREDLPEFKEEDIPLFGKMDVSKQVISLQNDNGTSYKLYIQVQNELAAAYNELRNELSMQRFGMPYKQLEELAKKEEGSEKYKTMVEAIRDVYPQRISEAEPKDVGG